MPKIKPISDLENDTEVLALMSALEEGEQSARENGWMSAEEVKEALGLK